MNALPIVWDAAYSQSSQKRISFRWQNFGYSKSGLTKRSTDSVLFTNALFP